MPTGRPQPALTGNTGIVYALAFAPRRKLLVSGGVAEAPGRPPQGEVRFWDLAARKQVSPVKAFQHPGLALALAPSQRTLAVGLADGEVLLHDLASHEDTHQGRLKGQVRSLAFSPDGKLLAAGGFDPAVHVWNLASRTEVAELRGHTGTIFALAFAPDGSTLAAAGSDEDIRLWDVNRGRLRAVLRGHTSNVLALAFTSIGA